MTSSDLSLYIESFCWIVGSLVLRRSRKQLKSFDRAEREYAATHGRNLPPW